MRKGSNNYAGEMLQILSMLCVAMQSYQAKAWCLPSTELVVVSTADEERANLTAQVSEESRWILIALAMVMRLLPLVSAFLFGVMCGRWTKSSPQAVAPAPVPEMEDKESLCEDEVWAQARFVPLGARAQETWIV